MKSPITSKNTINNKNKYCNRKLHKNDKMFISIPDVENSLLSESGEASSSAKNEGQDSECSMNRYQGGTETSGALTADHQQ